MYMEDTEQAISWRHGFKPSLCSLRKYANNEELERPHTVQVRTQISMVLFVWSLSSHSRIFHSYGDVTIAGEGLQISTYARHLWPHPLQHGSTVYDGHLRGPVALTPAAERLAVELPVFTTKVCRDRGSNPDLPHAK